MAEGDLILFRWRPHLPAKHAAILIAADRFVHAYEGSAVVVSALVPQWRKRIAGVFAFPA
jgi:NlpC/P60 family putative phage cell wall peptidase